MKTARQSLIIVWLFVLVPALAGAQTAGYENDDLSIFDYLIEKDFTEAVITTDLVKLLADRQAEPEYQPAHLLLTSEDGQMMSWEIELKTRGKYRRRVCDFAPLKLNFSKSQLKASGFNGFDKYKLVTHCDEDRYPGETAVLKEYIAYQLYETLTPQSYRTKVLRIRYVDSEGEVSSIRRYAFLIESDAQVEDRLKLTECEDCLGVTPEQVDRDAENLHAVFQYMIGNVDFNLPMARNLKLFGTGRTSGLVPIGYDFDFSGLVAPSYAIAAPHLGQAAIGDRVFLGFQVEDSLMESTLAKFEARKSTFFQIIRQERRLSSQARYEMRTYLNGFFDHLEELRKAGSKRTYAQMRSTGADIVPAGAKPEDYGVRR